MIWGKKRMAPKEYEEIIGRILTELDEDHANYQRLHMGYYGEHDSKAKNIYDLLVGLCMRIKNQFDSQERK
jgi:hypothetical protein